MIKEFKERGLVALADKLQRFDDKCYEKVKAAGEVAEVGKKVSKSPFLHRFASNASRPARSPDLSIPRRPAASARFA